MSRIFVAGHGGLVGSAICRRLRNEGIEPIVVDSASVDLTDQAAVNGWFGENRFDQVYLAAAKVGGINANVTCPAEYIRENLAI